MDLEPHRDLVGELFTALRAANIHPGNVPISLTMRNSATPSYRPTHLGSQACITRCTSGTILSTDRTCRRTSVKSCCRNCTTWSTRTSPRFCGLTVSAALIGTRTGTADRSYDANDTQVNGNRAVQFGTHLNSLPGSTTLLLSRTRYISITACDR